MGRTYEMGSFYVVYNYSIDFEIISSVISISQNTHWTSQILFNTFMF